MEGQSQSDVRPTETMGRTPDNRKCLTLLNHVVGAVAPDLEHREADATNHVAELVERDRRTEQRGLDILTLPMSRRTSPRLVLPSAQEAEIPIAIACTATNDGAPNEIVCPYFFVNCATNGFAIGTSLMSRLNDEMYAPGDVNCDESNAPSVARNSPCVALRLQLLEEELSVRGHLPGEHDHLGVLRHGLGGERREVRLRR